MRLQQMAYTVVGIGAAIGFVLLVSFDRWTIPTDDPALAASVEPTLHGGDLVLLWSRGAIDRGDMVRCDDPGEPGGFVAGRVLGVAGDKIEVSGNGVSTNGEAAAKLGACEKPTRNMRNPLGNDQVEVDCILEQLAGHRHPLLVGERTIFATTATVEPGKLWLVSDNRRFHLDSREVGQIDRASCKRIFYLLVGPAHGGEKDRGLSFVP